MRDFVHLHTHTEYSTLDGLSNIKKLVKEAKKLGQTSLAITDHGNMYGAMEFYNVCLEEDIKPIIGMESYIVPWGQNHKLNKRLSSHILLLAQNRVGYKNLMTLATLSSIEGFYHNARIDHGWLKEYSKGIICTTGCMGAEIPQLIMDGDVDKAEERLKWYQSVFGENYFVELQSHEGVATHLNTINRVLLDFAKRYGIGLVATNDLHYVTAADAIPHDHLLCVQTHAKIEEPIKQDGEAGGRFGFSDNSYYLKSGDEMEKLFPDEAIANTRLIADRCSVDLKDKTNHLPPFKKPYPFTSDADYLAFLCKGGFEEKYGIPYDSKKEEDVYLDSPLIPAAALGKPLKASALRERLDYELSVIKKMGFNSYFLIVWDILDFCRKNNIWWNVRGSAAGSMVAYTLGLTYLEPISNGLFFERFLNPARVSMPDIDMDFADDQRGAVVDYTVQKYGIANVSQIITFNKMKARSAIKDVGRVMGVKTETIDRITSVLPIQANLERLLVEWLEELPALKTLYEEPEIKRVVDMAIELEGTVRSAGTHAAGIVIADKPLIEYLPLNRLIGTNPLSKEIQTLTQFGMEHLEDIGLLKMDYLGLKSLTVMRKACELILARHGVTYRMETIPINDPSSYSTIAKGDTVGVFQCEGQGMTAVMTDMRPKEFSNIIAGISLYRPGPLQYIPQYNRRLNNREEAVYTDPSMIPALQETYGIMVYQEQVMRVCTDVAGMTLSQADSIRKAIGKKKEKDLLAARTDFVAGCVAQGHTEKLANVIYDDIVKFARYAFNKAHAANYAQLACQTAFLKANYRLEYLTALINSEYDDREKLEPIIAECRRQGIEFYPPDINKSNGEYVIEGTGIRYGLNSIKDVGLDKTRMIEEARGNKPFTSIQNFIDRVDPKILSKLLLEALFEAGAFDELGDREALLKSVPQFVLQKASKKAKAQGQVSVLDEFDLNDDTKSYYGTQQPVSDKLVEKEFERLGVYFSENPTSKALKVYDGHVTHKSTDIALELAGQKVVVAGVVTAVKEHTITKPGKNNGKVMAFVKFQDWNGKFEATVFPTQYEAHKDKLREGQAVTLFLNISNGERGLSVVVEAASVKPYDVSNLIKTVAPVKRDRVYIMFDRTDDDEARFSRMCNVLPLDNGLPVTIVLRKGSTVAVDIPRFVELNSSIAAKLALLNSDL